MKPTLDIVGHFGTTFSYATVASNVAAQLSQRGRLGRVTNLDPAWHSVHEWMKRPAEQGSHVMLFTVPHHYLDVYPHMYGRDRSAIFMSPNTDRLSDEHARTCAEFGTAFAPSRWCVTTTRRSLWDMVGQGPPPDIVQVPLGVDDGLLAGRAERIARSLRDVSLPRAHVLHLSTDQSWPGRKGTEELLAAWALLDRSNGAVLRLHVPPALLKDATYRARELDIDDSIEVPTGAMRGGFDAELREMFDWADLVVAPSRCEGFGIMLASALAAGVPLLCTYATGQRDFLSSLPGWLGIPTGEPGEMAGETGLAPTVEPQVLAGHLAVALDAGTRRSLLSALGADAAWETYGWRHASNTFAELLCEWLTRED